MKTRRSFVKKCSFSSIGLIGLRNFTLDEMPKEEVRRLIIAHTNDMHSHIDPFPANDPKFPGQGGMESRASEIDKLRAAHHDILLLDSGDIFQGTPYFNFFGGSLELKLMSLMGYDASTMGNHDFDGGMDGFIKAKESANFPFICSNYEMSDSPLTGHTLSHTLLKKNGLKIGLFGLGVELEGLVEKRNFEGVRYMDPMETAKKKIELLRKDLKCDLVICLSHLGYEYESKKISDRVLAKEVSGIDLILGGHTHTFLESPVIVRHDSGWETRINQVGWAGVKLGLIDLSMSKEAGKKEWRHLS
jgi:5'-nucleotidase